jgi:hypothetical protein
VGLKDGIIKLVYDQMMANKKTKFV